MAIAVDKLNKIYKDKKCADVHALKSVSFNLPDTGMVFILGKSGCGKSTLLNVLGGLDGFDDGDVIIDGKSIKGYKSRELDAYRNDYVGFVFQEHNLLEKESVKRNVSLALDLQSEKDTADKVKSALESVGIKDLAEQKCNCISGGQKQRVAIARALVKEPKLLLCDEPTGALDSETGASIFTLLKELSKDRLVVVVSHDRESAEKYGDRVIEIKDGKIISDSAPQEAAAKTEQAERKKKRGGLRFLRAFTTGAEYIIAKPVRMVICLLLSVIAFTCIGAADTVNSFERDSAMLYSMEYLDNKYYTFGKTITYDGVYALSSSRKDLTFQEADELSSLLNVSRADRVYRMVEDSNNNLIHQVVRRKGLIRYGHMEDEARIFGYVEADEQFCADYGFEIVAGSLPKNYGEVALPLHIFEFFKAYGYGEFIDSHSSYTEGEIFEYGDTTEINEYSDLIGKQISLLLVWNKDGENVKFTVSGIVDSGHVAKEISDVLFRGAERYDDFEKDIDFVRREIVFNSLFVRNGFRDYCAESGAISSEFLEESVACVMAPFTGSESEKLQNIRIYEKVFGKYNDECYHLSNFAARKVTNAEGFMSSVTDYAPYVIAVAVVIAVLFLIYYAIGTIDEKRREIGILRALGASRWDIFKIYLCEHGALLAVELLLSSIAAAIITVCLNASFVGIISGVVLIKFGIRQFGIMAAVAVLAVTAGISLPLIKLLKAKPVDVIADRK